MDVSKTISLEILFTPMIDIGFWTTLAQKKLEEYKLDITPKTIYAKYKLNNYKDKGNSSHLSFDVYSFNPSKTFNPSGPVEINLPGNLVILNTIEEFKGFNTEKALEQIVEENLKANSKEKLSFEKLFELVVYADLKSHIFHYFFIFPSILLENIENLEISPLKEKHMNNIVPFEKALRDYQMKEKIDFLLFSIRNPVDSTFKFIKFEDFFKYIEENNTEKNEIFLIFIDSFNQTNGVNALIKLALKSIERLMKSNELTIQTIIIKDFFYYNPNKCIEFNNTLYWKLRIQKSPISLIKYLPRSVSEPKSLDLKTFIDESSLAESAVNLNIKLMKWRLCPELDIDIIQKVKVLCFGAGTLGCQLSRNLIGWGVKNITFVDYGKVSYSNPVRQSLFNFEDSVKGGKPKAETAAESLRKIFPSINAKGIQLEIPMPGHFVSTPEQAKKILENLDIVEKLVEEHDVLYLLTDTRESRWLPTVLANKYNKICISVALGFDSYVVIRHGMSPKVHDIKKNGDRLACYFCNDILTPNNSLIDRTLDQQCTVTRPGVSFIASAYASELLISLLHHPLLNGAPSADELKDMSSTSLGVLPQHIRGNMSDFETRTLYGRAFENCIACSEYVLDEYLKDRDTFILKVINTPDFLQDVTKITETLQAMDLDNAIICLDDESDEEKKQEKC